MPRATTTSCDFFEYPAVLTSAPDAPYYEASRKGAYHVTEENDNMADSATTAQQKDGAFESIRSWVTYLETHGLETITLADLRVANHALNQTRVGVKGEDEQLEDEDPLWLAFKDAWTKANFGLHKHPLGVHDWAVIKEAYQKYRLTLEE
jgi:hypothetical protein